jgi:hypothetical protein
MPVRVAAVDRYIFYVSMSLSLTVILYFLVILKYKLHPDNKKRKLKKSSYRVRSIFKILSGTSRRRQIIILKYNVIIITCIQQF